MVLTLICKAGKQDYSVYKFVDTCITLHLMVILRNLYVKWAGGRGGGKPIVSVPKFHSQFSFSGFIFLRLKKCRETVIRYLKDWNTVR